MRKCSRRDGSNSAYSPTCRRVHVRVSGRRGSAAHAARLARPGSSPRTCRAAKGEACEASRRKSQSK